MNVDAAIKRAKEIVRASEWIGDMRANMTRIIGAGRVLAKRIDELEAQHAPPSDDDEPITREWMREEYGDTRVVVGLFTVTLNVRRATISVVCGACKNVVVRSVPAKTRRQLRDLLAALGYKQED